VFHFSVNTSTKKHEGGRGVVVRCIPLVKEEIKLSKPVSSLLNSSKLLLYNGLC
jgi:hypothetical protein